MPTTEEYVILGCGAAFIASLVLCPCISVPAALVLIASISIVGVAIVFLPIAVVVGAIAAIVRFFCLKKSGEKQAPAVSVDSVDKD